MSGDNTWSSATPLSNADFKALLSTPRPNWSGAGGSAAPQRPGGAPAAKKDARPFKPPKPRPKPVAQQGDDDDGPKYRDRAKERRDGANPDYEDAEAELAARGIRTEALDGLSIDDSKFLGGDMAHTHLVKGLDYALLQQERIRQQKQQQQQPRGPDDAPGPSPAAAAAAAAAGPRVPVAFATARGRAVFAALFSQPSARQRAAAVREMFLPRRLAFVYEFDGAEGGGGGGGDLPTTLRRSQADCPAPPELVPAGTDAVLLGRVARVATYVAAHLMGKGGQRKPKKKEHAEAIKAILAGSTPEAAAAAAAAEAAAAQQQQQQQQPQQQEQEQGQGQGQGKQQRARPVDDDEDIFGDAGTDYIPEMPAKKGGAAAAAAAGGARDGSYFDRKDDMADLPPPPPPPSGEADMELEPGEVPPAPGAPAGRAAAAAAMPPPPPQPPATLPAVWAGDAKWQPQKKELSAQTKALLRQMGDEAYGEYFPEAGAGIGGDDEEEEEGAGAKKKGAAAAGGAGAAAGGAEAEGKARPGAMSEDKRRDQKLDGQLGKIKQLFQDKGFGNEAAFKKPDRLEVAATPARKRPRI
ncbi:hypothetical protein Rsub_04474 [Raphidocelis subcapitata]|uniref:RED-like N-terminal domain-containing protein n=1 Tax=Raphidocelis subcapitata TaxID=307507 RepID=A0A2V0P4L1_9CHLO|nr:hypothetical protein Rsub_04474 [Raphidocelis subcapitata]|eukprot:GBF92127.1 hypothetical protein Rsub_04474 [Raphidocelis subcapitata]